MNALGISIPVSCFPSPVHLLQARGGAENFTGDPTQLSGQWIRRKALNTSSCCLLQAVSGNMAT